MPCHSPRGAGSVGQGVQPTCPAAACRCSAAGAAAGCVSTCEMGALPAGLPKASGVNQALTCQLLFPVTWFPGALSFCTCTYVDFF